MLILALDTSGKMASCALLRDGVLLETVAQDSMMDHSRLMLPLCEQLLQKHGLTFGDIDVYANSLRAIFAKLRAADIDTIFMTPNMMCTRTISMIAGDPYLGGAAEVCSKRQNEGVMDAFMDKAREVCAECGVPVCDCYADWKRLAEMGADVTSMLANFVNHPTREMHRLFADRLFDMIFLND